MYKVDNKKKVVHTQVQKLEKGEGISFWVKPFLHPNAHPSYLEVNVVILVTICSLCKRGFNFFDIVMGSCKHVYHPFYLAEVIRRIDKCGVCAKVFHLDWWSFWGFCNHAANVKELATQLDLENVHKELWQAIEYNCAMPIVACKC